MKNSAGGDEERTKRRNEEMWWYQITEGNTSLMISSREKLHPNDHHEANQYLICSCRVKRGFGRKRDIESEQGKSQS